MKLIKYIINLVILTGSLIFLKRLSDLNIIADQDLMIKIPFLDNGTGQGYQKELIEFIPVDFQLPIILSGGAGKYQHFIDGLEDNKVDAVATAHLFNFIGSSLEDSRTELLKEGFNLAKWDVNICESIKDFFSQT